MKKVFIFGSARVGNKNYLPDVCVQKINQYIEEGCSFIVSDCCGVDSIVQDILKVKSIQNVVIYSAGEQRYKACDIWKYCNTNDSITFKKEFTSIDEARAFKDFVACFDCDEGFGIFLNQGSKCSRVNVNTLINLGKTCYIFSDPGFHERNDNEHGDKV